MSLTFTLKQELLRQTMLVLNRKKKFKVKSFTTTDSFEKVYAYLNSTAQERFQETSKDLDPEIRSFIESLSKEELAELTRTAGSDLQVGKGQV